LDNQANKYIISKLQERQFAGNYRELKLTDGAIDFCSNDYLGFARSIPLKQSIDTEMADQKNSLNGSAGSRLLAGNTAYAEELEKYIADYHGYDAGLIYNSGYDANLGLFSSLPQKGDTIICDELIHASIIDGARLSFANRFSFKHNDLISLEEKLKNAKGNIYVVVESIYSMDGDMAPLKEIIELVNQHNAQLIVDEAHATGVFGKGLIDQLNLQGKIFAQIVTFGKALGCHGAIILSNNLLRKYLINFSRSFIYTTAAPLHQLVAIKMAYNLLMNTNQQVKLHQNINYFKSQFIQNKYQLVKSDSAIQCVLLGSNEKAKALAGILQQNNLDVRPILSPTVAAGYERLRICLHSYNIASEISRLVKLINEF